MLPRARSPSQPGQLSRSKLLQQHTKQHVQDQAMGDHDNGPIPSLRIHKYRHKMLSRKFLCPCSHALARLGTCIGKTVSSSAKFLAFCATKVAFPQLAKLDNL